MTSLRYLGVTLLVTMAACGSSGDGGAGDGAAGADGAAVMSDGAAGADGAAVTSDGAAVMSDGAAVTSDSATVMTDGAAGTGDAGGAATLPDGEKGATVIVDVGPAPLVAGMTYKLTQGKFAGQRNDDEFFANLSDKFMLSSPYMIDSIETRFSGFNRVGTFACGERAKPNDDYAIQTGLDIWVFENTKSLLSMFSSKTAGATCSITVTKLDKATAIEGYYTATLKTAAGATLQAHGAFRAPAQ